MGAAAQMPEQQGLRAARANRDAFAPKVHSHSRLGYNKTQWLHDLTRSNAVNQTAKAELELSPQQTTPQTHFQSASGTMTQAAQRISALWE